MTDAKPRIAAWRGGDTIYVDGKPVHRNPMQFFVRALVTPITVQNQMKFEGNRLTERYSVYQVWRDTIPVADDADTTPENMPMYQLSVNDKLLLDDKAFIVEETKFWGAYVEATVVFIDVGKQPPPTFPRIPE